MNKYAQLREAFENGLQLTEDEKQNRAYWLENRQRKHINNATHFEYSFEYSDVKPYMITYTDDKVYTHTFDTFNRFMVWTLRRLETAEYKKYQYPTGYVRLKDLFLQASKYYTEHKEQIAEESTATKGAFV